MPNLARSSPIPLFQRLCAQDGELGDARSFDAARLQGSIANELATLLNTRCGLTMTEFLTCHGTVLDYGVPDFSAMSRRSTTDLLMVSKVIQHAIYLFEPRLSQTQVLAVAKGGLSSNAQIRIVAAVRLGLTLRRVDFEMPVSLSDGTSGTL